MAFDRYLLIFFELEMSPSASILRFFLFPSGVLSARHGIKCHMTMLLALPTLLLTLDPRLRATANSVPINSCIPLASLSRKVIRMLKPSKALWMILGISASKRNGNCKYSLKRSVYWVGVNI